MEFSVPPQAAQFREQAREFFAEAYPDELRPRRFERPHDRQFFRAASRWQQEHLAGRDAYEVSAFFQEAARSGIELTTHAPLRAIIVHGKMFMDEMSRFIPVDVQERTLKKAKFLEFLINEDRALLLEVERILA